MAGEKRGGVEFTVGDTMLKEYLAKRARNDPAIVSREHDLLRQLDQQKSAYADAMAMISTLRADNANMRKQARALNHRLAQAESREPGLRLPPNQQKLLDAVIAAEKRTAELAMNALKTQTEQKIAALTARMQFLEDAVARANKTTEEQAEELAIYRNYDMYRDYLPLDQQEIAKRQEVAHLIMVNAHLTTENARLTKEMAVYQSSERVLQQTVNTMHDMLFEAGFGSADVLNSLMGQTEKVARVGQYSLNVANKPVEEVMEEAEKALVSVGETAKREFVEKRNVGPLSITASLVFCVTPILMLQDEGPKRSLHVHALFKNLLPIKIVGMDTIVGTPPVVFYVVECGDDTDNLRTDGHTGLKLTVFQSRRDMAPGTVFVPLFLHHGSITPDLFVKSTDFELPECPQLRGIAVPIQDGLIDRRVGIQVFAVMRYIMESVCIPDIYRKDQRGEAAWVSRRFGQGDPEDRIIMPDAENVLSAAIGR